MPGPEVRFKFGKAQRCKPLSFRSFGVSFSSRMIAVSLRQVRSWPHDPRQKRTIYTRCKIYIFSFPPFWRAPSNDCIVVMTDVGLPPSQFVVG